MFELADVLQQYVSRSGYTSGQLAKLSGLVSCLLPWAEKGATPTMPTHLAYQLRSYFPDGILWASVNGSEPMSVSSTFGGAYGVDVSQYTDLNSRSRAVRELLADKRTFPRVKTAVLSSERLLISFPPSAKG